MSHLAVRPLAALMLTAMTLVGCSSLPSGVSKTDMPGVLLDENIKLPYTAVGQKINYKVSLTGGDAPFESTGSYQVSELNADGVKLVQSYKAQDGTDKTDPTALSLPKLFFQLKQETPGKAGVLPDGGSVTWEKVTVPAGEFDATKIALKEGASMWVSSTAGLVKVVVPGTPQVTFELTK